MYAILIISPLIRRGVISLTYMGTLLMYYIFRIFLHGKGSRKKISYYPCLYKLANINVPKKLCKLKIPLHRLYMLRNINIIKAGEAGSPG